MKKYRLKKDLPMLEAGNEVILELKKINDKKVGFYYDIKSTNTNRVFDSFCVISKSKINEWLEEIPEKPKSVFEIKEGDKYYYINSWGEIFGIILKGGFCDNDRLEIGNVFLTKEEAEKELERRTTIMKIKKYCWENSIELANKKIITNSNITKYYLEYDLNDKKFDIIRTNYQYAGYHFTFQSYEDAEKILEKFEDELKIILDF